MNRTKSDRSALLAEAMFDEIVAPLAAAKRASSAQTYFPLWREANTKSYFELPSLKTMSPADFEFQGGGSPDGLIDALAAFWAVQGETELAAMAPRLKEFASALDDEAADNDGKVDILCYTLF